MGLRIDDKLVVYANLSNLSVLPQDPFKGAKVLTGGQFPLSRRTPAAHYRVLTESP